MKLFYNSLFLVCSILGLSAQNFTNVVTFGDDTTDTGNTFASTGGALPSDPFMNGSFTNGDNWLDCFTTSLGHDSTNSFAGGDNYSEGGAQVTGDGFSEDLISLEAQTSNYLSSVSNVADPDALYIAWIGAGDVIDSVGGADQIATLNTALSNFTTSLVTLSDAGAQQIVIPNIPDLGLSPSFNGTFLQPEATALTTYWNTEITNTVIPALVAAGLTVYDPDIFSLFQDIQANPSQYGYTNVTDQGQNDPGVIAGTTDLNDFLWIDNLHVTEATHEAICDTVYQSVVPEPTAGFLLSLATLGFFSRRRR